MPHAPGSRQGAHPPSSCLPTQKNLQCLPAIRFLNRPVVGVGRDAQHVIKLGFPDSQDRGQAGQAGRPKEERERSPGRHCFGGEERNEDSALGRSSLFVGQPRRGPTTFGVPRRAGQAARSNARLARGAEQGSPRVGCVCGGAREISAAPVFFCFLRVGGKIRLRSPAPHFFFFAAPGEGRGASDAAHRRHAHHPVRPNDQRRRPGDGA